MSFFRQFPVTTYDFGALIQNINVPRADQIRVKSGVKTNVVDLFRNATVNQGKLNGAVAYQFYRIQNGDRPDTVSQLLYRDPDYYWTFFVINNTLKSGLPAWPMSPGQLERYMAAEYDDYGVLVMSESLILTGIGYVNEVGTLNVPTPSDRTLWLSPKQIASRVGLNPGWSYSLNEARVNQINALNGIDFSTNPNVCLREISSGALARIVKYDSDRHQLWIKKGTVGVISITSQTDTGGPFSSIPRATVSGGNGIGCMAEPILSSGSSGLITGLRLLEPGSGYISEFDGGTPIKVAISETPAISAEAYTYRQNDGMLGIGVSNFGAGYSRSPLVEVTYPAATTVFPGLASFTAPFTGTSGSVTLTGSITSGSVTTATLTSEAVAGATSLEISFNSDIVVGMAMYGSGIPEGTRVTSVTSPTVIGISTPVSAGGSSNGSEMIFSLIAAGMNVTGSNIQVGSVVNSVVIHSLLNHIAVNISEPLSGNTSSATLTFQRGIPGYGNIDVITPTGFTFFAGQYLAGGNISSSTGAAAAKINAISTPLPIPVASRTGYYSTASSITGSSTIVVQLNNGLQAGQKAVGGNLGSITDGSVSVLSVDSPVVESVPSDGSISPPDSGLFTGEADTVRVNISAGNISQISISFLDYVSGANLYTGAIASGGLVGPFQVIGIDAGAGRIDIRNRGGGNFTSGSVIPSGSSLTFTRPYSEVTLATSGSYFSSAVTASASAPLLFYTNTSTNLNLQTTGDSFTEPVVTATANITSLSVSDSVGNIIPVEGVSAIISLSRSALLASNSLGEIGYWPVPAPNITFIPGMSAKFILPKIELTVSGKIIDSSFIDRLSTFNPSDFPAQVPSTFTLETLNPNFTNLNPGSAFNLAEEANYAWVVSYNSWRDGNSEKFVSAAIPSASLIFGTDASGKINPVTYAPYATISSSRNAPYSYSDSSGQTVTAHDALAGNVAPVSTTLYADHELELNDARANIRVVRAEDIRAFAQTYRATINT